jgi:hypothetical protein
MPRIRKQAVIVIHGIGEQRPMDTLRSFVASVLPTSHVYSKPDPFSGSYELRRLTTSHGPRHHTHFFELYWADLVQGTTILHLAQWAKSLLWRWPWATPRHLRPMWVVTWALLALLAGLGAGIGLGIIQASLGGPAILALVLLASAFYGFLIRYAGDAARYLSPSPRNVAIRRAIRDAGVSLLRRLHESGKYDRIILVGHSLGSVIAYDLITHYWVEAYRRFQNPARQPQARLEAYEQLLTGPNTGAVGEDIHRRHQRAVWTELRRHGHSWRITDLVTLGSPLAHAAILIARNERDLVQRFRDRELPTDPPQLDRDGTLAFVLEPPIRNDRRQLVSPRAPHHAAPFACTRWTNLYFPAYGGLFGDIVGGPVGPVFGEGVLDVPVSDGTLRSYTLWSHTRYWKLTRGGVGTRPSASAELRRVLDLLFTLDRE